MSPFRFAFGAPRNLTSRDLRSVPFAQPRKSTKPLPMRRRRTGHPAAGTASIYFNAAAPRPSRSRSGAMFGDRATGPDLMTDR